MAILNLLAMEQKTERFLVVAVVICFFVIIGCTITRTSKSFNQTESKTTVTIFKHKDTLKVKKNRNCDLKN